MAETLQQRRDAIREVLQKIQNEVDFDSLTFEEQRIAKECYDAKYFEGIVVEQMISGRIVAEYVFPPRLTNQGMEFLYAHQDNSPSKVEVSFSDDEHNLQAENQRQERAEKEAERKRDRKFQILDTLLGAVVGSLLTLFVEHFCEIIDFLSELFG